MYNEFSDQKNNPYYAEKNSIEAEKKYLRFKLKEHKFNIK